MNGKFINKQNKIMLYEKTFGDKVVKVDNTGLITAVSSGTATIIVQTEDGGYIDMTNVTVLQPVTSIELSQTEMSVKKGTVFWLNATVLPIWSVIPPTKAALPSPTTARGSTTTSQRS